MRGEVFRALDGEWRWRIVGANGEIMAASESYVSLTNAQRGLEDLCLAIIRQITHGDWSDLEIRARFPIDVEP